MDIQNRAYFSGTSLVLNDANVRESNVIQPSLKESVVNILLAVKRKWNFKTMYVPFMCVYVLYESVLCFEQ